MIVCTHADSHFEYTKRALEMGKNVLVEGPFMPTLAQAKELFELARSKGLTAVPHQNRRSDPCFLTVKKVTESGRLGKTVEVESYSDYYRLEAGTKPGLLQDGVFYGLGVHIMNQIISLFGRPDRVAHDIRSLRNKANPDDTLEAQLFYDDLKTIVKTSHLMKIDYPKFTVHGTKSSFVKYGIDQQGTSLKANIMPGEPGFAADDSVGVLEYVNDDGVTVKEEVKPEAGDYGRVYDAVYQTLTAGASNYAKESRVLTNLEVLERTFEQATPAIITLAKQPAQTPLGLFIFLGRRSQFSPSTILGRLSPHSLHRKHLRVNTMTYLRKANDRGHANHGRLDSWHTFSFANYYDLNFMGSSALRVINGDVIDAGQGFGTHPYKDTEIPTYVLEGAVEHQDSMGNKEQVLAGEFQIMSAGTGIRHSEYNPSNTEKPHLYQTRIIPQENGITSHYEQRRFDAVQGRQLVLSPDVRDGSLKVYQDMELYRWALAKDEQPVYQIATERRVWIQVVKGNATINDTKATTSDGLAIWDGQAISIHADSDSEVLPFDLPPV